jgi:Outer membrane protein beta-barrel domain
MLRRSSIRGSSTLLITVAALGLAAVPAHAQSSSAGPPRVEFTLSPGGGIFFPGKNAEPDFGNYRLGGSVTVNLTRFIGVEAEVGSSIGISQQVDFGPTPGVERKTPNLLDYSPNFVVSVPTGSSVVPYVTAGAGALTVFSREELSIDHKSTYSRATWEAESSGSRARAVGASAATTGSWPCDRRAMRRSSSAERTATRTGCTEA